MWRLPSASCNIHPPPHRPLCQPPGGLLGPGRCLWYILDLVRTDGTTEHNYHGNGKSYIKLDHCVKAYINALLQTWKKHFSREVYGKLICCLPGTIAIIYYYTRWISLKFLTLIALQSTLLNSKPFQFSSDNNHRPSTCFGCWSSAGCSHSVSQR